jgi:ABC-type transport system involved in multi-copper enzyme maturation permease subunit
MIRMTWLQFRTQAAVAVGGLAILAIILAITGPHLLHLYDTIVATCAAHGDCSTASSAFLKNDRSLQIGVDALVVIVPGVIGLFWGPPLVARELEAGTFRLAWTQSVTRMRWLAVKLGVIGLACMAVTGLVSLAVTWWSSPVDRANMSVYTSFDQRDLVPIGYAAFAFAIGVSAGVLIRRTLPAMASALVVFVAARLSFNHWVLPHLFAPKNLELALNPTSAGFGSINGGPATLVANFPSIQDAWVYSTEIVNKAGHPLTAQLVARTCPGLAAAASKPAVRLGHATTAHPIPGGFQAIQQCLEKVGMTYHEVVAYQPASRYWAFQWYELAIYLCAALILAGMCFWWVRRRLS